MHRAKSFFYVCAGICLLALAYHLGATSAQAQAPGDPVVAFNGGAVVTANGNIYCVPANAPSLATWVLASNVFTGAPTPAHAESWGQLKQRYK